LLNLSVLKTSVMISIILKRTWLVRLHSVLPAVGPTQSPIQWVPGALSPGVKLPGHEADNSPLSIAEVKNSGATPPPPTSSWHYVFYTIVRIHFFEKELRFISVELRFLVTWPDQQKTQKVEIHCHVEHSNEQWRCVWKSKCKEAVCDMTSGLS
jgi:hypothetical protein